MARTPRLAANLLLLLTCTAILFAVTELVLRARWEPRARTLAPSANTRTTTSEYDVEIVTNPGGFRDDVMHRAHSSPRVAVIGDSFVFGSGVASGDLVTSRLARHSTREQPLDIWNFGAPGTGPCNALYLWRGHVRAVRPDVVIVALYAGNDAGDALRESSERQPRFVTIARAKALWYRLRSLAKPAAPATTAAPPGGWNAFGVNNPATLEALLGAAQTRGVPEDSVRARLEAVPDSLVKDAFAFRSNPFNLAEAVIDPDGLRHNLLLDTPELNQGWIALESALGELREEVTTAGSQLALVCIPAAVQVDSTYWWLKNLGVRLDDRVLRNTEFQNRLARFAARKHIPMLDLLPVMRAHPDTRLYYEQDGHWNAAGHDVAARAMAQWLEPMLPAAR